MLGAVIFTAGWLLVEQIQGKVNVGADYISDLGRVGADQAWLWNSATILAGLLMLLLTLARCSRFEPTGGSAPGSELSLLSQHAASSTASLAWTAKAPERLGM